MFKRISISPYTYGTNETSSIFPSLFQDHEAQLKTPDFGELSVEVAQIHCQKYRCRISRQTVACCIERAAAVLAAAWCCTRGPPSLPTPSQFTWLPTKFFMHYKMLMLIHTAAEKQGPRYLPDSVTLHSTGHRPRSPLQVSAHPPAAASLWVVAFQPLCSAPCRRAAPRCHLPPPVKGSVPGAAVPGADCTSL